MEHNAKLLNVFVSAIESKRTTGNPALVRLWDSMPNSKTLIALSIAQAEQTLVCISPYHKVDCKNTTAHSTQHFAIRWFLAGKEIQRCGHGTIAAAAYIDHITQQQSHPPPQSDKYFYPLVGDILAISSEYDVQYSRQRYTLFFNCAEMENSQNMSTANTLLDDNTLQKYIQPKVISILKKHHKLTTACWAKTKYPEGYIIVQLNDVKAISRFMLTEEIINALGNAALIISAPDEQLYHDIIFRYFAPAYGANEDMATGSAAPILHAFWQPKIMQPTMRARQLSAAGGEMLIQLYNNNALDKQTKVRVSGYIKVI